MAKPSFLGYFGCTFGFVVLLKSSPQILFGVSSKRHVWKRPCNAHHLHSTVPTVKHGGGSTMLCFYVLGTGALVRVEETLNSTKYIDILHENLLYTAY